MKAKHYKQSAIDVVNEINKHLEVIFVLQKEGDLMSLSLYDKYNSFCDCRLFTSWRDLYEFTRGFQEGYAFIKPF